MIGKYYKLRDNFYFHVKEILDVTDEYTRAEGDSIFFHYRNDEIGDINICGAEINDIDSNSVEITLHEFNEMLLEAISFTRTLIK